MPYYLVMIKILDAIYYADTNVVNGVVQFPY